MDEEHIVRCMVGELHKHPAEWLTFTRLTSLIRIPDCDADIIAAIAEYRCDLFAPTNDRKLKLRSCVIEDIARAGFANWRAPKRPEHPQPSASPRATHQEAQR